MKRVSNHGYALPDHGATLYCGGDINCRCLGLDCLINTVVQVDYRLLLLNGGVAVAVGLIPIIKPIVLRVILRAKHSLPKY